MIPSTLFCSLWGAILLGLAFSGDAFYALSDATLAIVLLGGISFSGGSAVAFLRNPRREAPAKPTHLRFPHRTGTLLTLALLLLCALLPFYWLYLRQLANDPDPTELWTAIRHSTSPDLDPRALGPFAYVAALSTFSALAAVLFWLTTGKGRARAFTLVTVALLYQVGTAARTGSLFLIFGLVAIAWLSAGRPTLRSILMGTAIAVTVFSVIAVLLGKGASADSTFSENVASLATNIRVYILGGTVAFDQYIRGLVHLPSGVRTFRFFALAANLLGARFPVPELVLDYVDTPEPTNVYTMFLPYYADFGWGGVLVLLVVLGWLSTVLYLGCQRGLPQCYLLYALFFACMVLGIANDQFYAAFSLWLQMAAFCVVLFGRPTALPMPLASQPPRQRTVRV